MEYALLMILVSVFAAIVMVSVGFALPVLGAILHLVAHHETVFVLLIVVIVTYLLTRRK